MTTFSVFVKKANKTYHVDLSELSDAVRQYVFEYGLRQSLADAAAGADNSFEALEKVNTRFDKLMAGEIPSGGGASLSEEEKEARALLVAALKGCGIKGADATKLAKSPLSAMKEILAAKFPGQDIPYSAVEKNLETVYKTAAANVAARETVDGFTL